jgi:hypothetical protein
MTCQSKPASRLATLATLATALAALGGCASTTYARLPSLPAPDGPARPAARSYAAPRAGSARIVVEAVAGGASVVELSDSARARAICAQTPCTAEVPPGRHRYRLVPQHGATAIPANSKDSVQATPVDAEAVLEAGQTRILRASLGRREVHRSFPVGRGIAWALVGVGAIVAVVGLAAAATSPSGSPDEDNGRGIAYLGAGVAGLGLGLWGANATDNETVTDRPGAFRWTF